MSQGIFGLIDFEKPIDRAEETAAALEKRVYSKGAKNSHFSCKWGKGYMLGMKRICKAPLHQPCIARNEEAGCLSLIHGEVLNYDHLKQHHLNNGGMAQAGDLDLILNMYRKEGFRFVRQLNGLFALGILDLKNRSFALLNDRFGMAHQVYWTVLNGRLCFATHLKALLTCTGIRKEIDPEGLNLFLKYSYIPSPWTIFQDIKKLPPGSLLLFRDGQITIQESHWSFNTGNGGVKDLEEGIPLYRRLLRESISKRLDGGNGEVGILLSGGLDSSANVALAAECTEKRLKTFAVGFDDPAFDERPYARLVARRFGTQHFETAITGEEIEQLPGLLWHLEEPYFEFGLFLTYSGMARASQEVDTILGGEGADQLFGTGGFAGGLPVVLRYLLLKSHLLGPASVLTRRLKGSYFYERDNLAFKARLLLNRVVDFNNWYFYGYDDRELSLLHNDPELARVPALFSNRHVNHPLSFAELFTETQINQDIRHYVNENVMVKSGRMADMLDLTLREPYLDTDLADFLVSIDYCLKRSGNVIDHLKGNIKTKFLHRQAMESLLPREIMTKPKQGGFVPVMIFLGNPELRRRIYHHLRSSEVIREYFDVDYLNSLFSGYEHLLKRGVYWHNFCNSKAKRILFLLTFEIWHRLFMRSDPLGAAPEALDHYLA